LCDFGYFANKNGDASFIDEKDGATLNILSIRMATHLFIDKKNIGLHRCRFIIDKYTVPFPIRNI